jgi:cell division septation protein DedD
MNEHRPREIQLTSKQLVFVFMSTVLVAVVVFLLGVWVGRGIDTGSMAATEDVVRGGVPKSEPSNPPAATPQGPGKPLTYPDALAGSDKGGAAASVQPPAPPADPPASGAPGPSPPQSSSPPAPPPQPEKSQPTAEKPQAAAPKPPAPDADFWVIQVGAFSARSGAEKVAAEFKGKGYPVTVTPGPTFRVHIGPYPKRAEADQIASRLRKEGKDASVTKPR